MTHVSSALRSRMTRGTSDVCCDPARGVSVCVTRPTDTRGAGIDGQNVNVVDVDVERLHVTERAFQISGVDRRLNLPDGFNIEAFERCRVLV